MSPFWSTARLPIQRFRPSLAPSCLPCWTGVVATVPPPTLSCAHWIPVGVLAPQQRIVWLTQSDSLPPMFVYCACIIRRSPSESTKKPPGVCTSRGEGVKLAWLTLVGPVNVELATLL